MRTVGLSFFDTVPVHEYRRVVHPRAGEVHLNCLEFAANRAPVLRLLDWLSAEDRQRAASFRLDACRERFVLSHAYARAVLANYIGVHPQRVPLRTDLLGRPVIAVGGVGGSQTIGFSLSHCDTHAAIAVAATVLVGVDIEGCRPGVDGVGIARRYLAREEANALAGLSPEEAQKRFARLWTCKEAFVKAIGLGLFYPLDRFVVGGVGRSAPELISVAPEYGAPSTWSLRTDVLADGSYVSTAVKYADAVVLRRFGFP